jgi:hypothetical protein
MNTAIATVLLLSVPAFAQARPQQHSSVCLRASFGGQVNEGQSFSHSLGNGLVLHLDPLKGDWGWQLTISPEGSNDDWAYPVNPPLRIGNSEYLGTGYGESAREVLSRAHEIRFPLTNAEYLRMSKLAYVAVWSDQSKQKSGPDPTTAYLDALKTLRTGAVIVSVPDYDKDGPPEKVRWMKFSAVLIAPQGFRGVTNLDWTTGSCSLKLPSGEAIETR